MEGFYPPASPESASGGRWRAGDFYGFYDFYELNDLNDFNGFNNCNNSPSTA
jgi:hypothetical protein